MPPASPPVLTLNVTYYATSLARMLGLAARTLGAQVSAYFYPPLTLNSVLARTSGCGFCRELTMIGPTRHLAELERNLTRLTYSCRDKRKLGGTPRFGVRADGSYDGEWHVCFDSHASWRSPCTAFSFGLGGDWSFEEAMPQRALHPCTCQHLPVMRSL